MQEKSRIFKSINKTLKTKINFKSTPPPRDRIKQRLQKEYYNKPDNEEEDDPN